MKINLTIFAIRFFIIIITSQHSFIWTYFSIFFLFLFYFFNYNSRWIIIVLIIISISFYNILSFIIFWYWFRCCFFTTWTINTIKPITTIFMMIPSCTTSTFKFFWCTMYTSPIDMTKFGIIIPAIIFCWTIIFSKCCFKKKTSKNNDDKAKAKS